MNVKERESSRLLVAMLEAKQAIACGWPAAN